MAEGGVSVAGDLSAPRLVYPREYRGGTAVAKFIVIALLAGAAGAAGGVAATWATPSKPVDCVVRVDPPKDITADELKKLLKPK